MPDDRFVFVNGTVTQIGELESKMTYNLSGLYILNAIGLKLNDVNFQPLKKLWEINIQNFAKDDSQTLDFSIFKNLDSIRRLYL